MIPQGLSATDLRTYLAQLADTREVRVRASLRTLAGDPTSDLTPYLDDGQINLDNGGQVTRSATLVLHDPRRSLPFETDHPSDTALHLDREIRVAYDVRVGDEWVPCPVMTGPVTKLDRDGDMVTVECQGKETLFLGAAWRPITLAKRMKKTDAITRILTDANPVYAETRMDLPDLPARMPEPRSLTRDAQPWVAAQRIAHSMGMHLFYDGRGIVRLRHKPGTALFAFTGQHHVVAPPQVSYSADVVNAVYVLGAKPKGAKTHVHAVAVAPANHPLSPQRIGRYLLPGGQVTHADHAKTVAECQEVADRRLHDGLLQSVDVSFDSTPIPFLDPLDLCHVHTDDAPVTFRLKRFSLPLLAGEPMTVGYHRVVSMRARHRRRHHK